MSGWQALADTNIPLLTYKRAKGEEGAKLIPGLAEAMPEVSSDGTTYTLTLRDGLKYSDGSPVKANDFEHTIKRVINLESGGSSFFTGNIVGAAEYEKAGKAKGDISGITADDATRKITIKIKQPSGQFPFILAMDFAGLVPGDTPFTNETKSPPPGVGPFKITSVATGRSFVMEKNANYPEIEGLPRRAPGQDHDQRGHAGLPRDHRRAAEQGRLLRRAAQQRRPARVPRTRLRSATAARSRTRPTTTS